MKLADRTVEIHSRGLDSSNQFTIAQTSKMFKILSDSLYSDKVMAVIRELSTNAYDAHVAAGNKNPFKVTLPTQANPNFTVRDYGTGLSQKDMEELYTTYGASNKNDSNDFVGCLGLGSKSPFAYTKSFSTTSYYNGKAYNYIAAMDEGGVPSLNLFGITETSEPNGLEISFAVKQYDFTEFSNKSKRVFHYFKMKPIIEGGVCDTLKDHSYSHTNTVIEGKGWKIGRVSSNHYQYPSHHYGPGSGVVAIMGNIAYPVDATKIIGDEKEINSNDAIQRWNRAFKKADVDNWKNLVREILNSGLYLEIQFGIGELEMDVSREGLQYTKNVINVLRERTQEIYLTLKEDMSKKLEACTNLVDAYQTYYNLSDLAGGWTAGASWTDTDGKTHELTSGKDLEYTFKKSKQLYVFNFRTAGYRSRRMVYLTNQIHYQTIQGVGEYYWSGAKKNGKMAFFRCDVKGAETAKKIVTKYCNTNDCFAYLMIDSDNPEDSSKGFDKLIKDIGGESNVLNVSDYRSLLSGGTRQSRGSTGTISKDEIFAISNLGADKNCALLGGNELNDSSYLRELSDDLMEYIEDEDNEIVYVPILRYASVDGYPEIHKIVSLSQNTDTSLGKNLFDSQKIFAIKQSAVDKLKKEGINLVNFNEWFKKWADKIVNKLIDKVAVYGDIIGYVTGEFNCQDKTFGDGYYYYHCKYSDRKIVYHIFNLFGLDYRKHIQNSDFCDALDQWLMMEFFSVTIHRDRFDITRFKKDDYYAHIATILNKYGMNGIDPSQIKDSHTDLKKVKYVLDNLYGGDNPITTSNKHTKMSSDIIAQMPKMTDIRKNLKDGVDSNPILKYIVGTVDVDGELRKLSGSNPIKVHQNSYNGLPAWFSNISDDNIEKLKSIVGSAF
jgi:hypothetical protein